MLLRLFWLAMSKISERPSLLSLLVISVPFILEVFLNFSPMSPALTLDPFTFLPCCLYRNICTKQMLVPSFSWNNLASWHVFSQSLLWVSIPISQVTKTKTTKHHVFQVIAAYPIFSPLLYLQKALYTLENYKNSSLQGVSLNILSQ